MGTLTDLDCGGGVGVPHVGGADLLPGQSAVAHVGHQGAVGGVDVRAEAAITLRILHGDDLFFFD